MYTPAHFDISDTAVLLDLIRQHPLAAIVTAGPDGLVADHIPLLHVPAAEGDEGASGPGRLIGHVAKANPLWRAGAEQEHLLIFQGASAYVSPNWYPTKREHGKAVPTWNYAVVHVSATLRPMHEPAQILAVLEQLTTRHEAAQPQPWQVADAPADYIARMCAGVVGVEFRIRRLQGKWKVSQNQPAPNRQGVIDGLQAQGSEAAGQMAALVQRFGAEG